MSEETQFPMHYHVGPDAEECASCGRDFSDLIHLRPVQAPESPADELTRLRAEVAQLREERDRLQKERNEARDNRDEWWSRACDDLERAESAEARAARLSIADELLGYLADWVSDVRGLNIINSNEGGARSITGRPGMADTLYVGPAENLRDALLDSAMHDGSDDLKRDLRALLTPTGADRDA